MNREHCKTDRRKEKREPVDTKEIAITPSANFTRTWWQSTSICFSPLKKYWIGWNVNGCLIITIHTHVQLALNPISLTKEYTHTYTWHVINGSILCAFALDHATIVCFLFFQLTNFHQERPTSCCESPVQSELIKASTHKYPLAQRNSPRPGWAFRYFTQL